MLKLVGAEFWDLFHTQRAAEPTENAFGGRRTASTQLTNPTQCVWHSAELSEVAAASMVFSAVRENLLLIRGQIVLMTRLG